MLILNFAHPLTEGQRLQIETLIGQPISEVKAIKSQLNQAEPLLPQVVALADAAGLTDAERSGRAMLINPPALNFLAVALLAELHGRMGYFPTCLRLRPMQGTTPPQFEVAEIVDLQTIRANARARREN